MKKTVKWRFTLIALAIIICVVYLAPNMPFELPESIKKILPTRGITLGLDLQGGIFLIYEVQGQRAVDLTASRRGADIRKLLKKESLKADVSTVGSDVQITGDIAKIKDAIVKNYSNFEFTEKENSIVVFMKDTEVQWIKDTAVEQALETIRNRVDQFGVAEPTIRRRGESEIIVQLPGVKDPNRAIELIGKTAVLEFKLVDDESPLSAELPNGLEPSKKAEFEKKIKDSGKMPKNSEILYLTNTVPDTDEVFLTPFLLKKDTILTGEYLSEARVAIDNRDNQPYVSINFDSEGAKRFEEITGENVKKRLAIILDGNVYSAPVIQERISGGTAQISGSFTMAEARDLAIVLRAGSLPAPVEIQQNVTVGPSLGRDSIEAGKKAAIIALLLVIVFMMVYYKLSGLIADVAMLLNILFLLGAMAALKATLTMPGIAGVVLAIGMAVDTNVLMFERIREELRIGKTPRAAIDSGYNKAFFTIVDSHMTTLITAAVLFQFGTGPIKGFAVTLSIGIIINLFTSLIGTKAVFDYLNNKKEVKALSI